MLGAWSSETLQACLKVGVVALADCHTRFLRPKPDAHRMYAQDQVVIHTVRM
jgi:Glu-tRNA(Gln) amidotransferase subunit E-like FAD-binding protein